MEIRGLERPGQRMNQRTQIIFSLFLPQTLRGASCGSMGIWARVL